MRFGHKYIGHGNKPNGIRSLFSSIKNGLKGRLPSIPFSLTNNNNLRLCCGVIRGTATNNANDPITWAFIVTGGHAFTGFTGTITTDGDGNVVLSLPAGKIMAIQAEPDEVYAGFNLHIGAKDNGDNTVDIGTFLEVGNYTGRLTGNGTNWDLSNMSGFNVVVNSLSEIQFNPPKPYGNTGTNGQNLRYWAGATAKYVGTTAGLTIKRTIFLRDEYDASGNTYPTSGGSGTAGAIKQGDLFYLSKAGTLNGSLRAIGDSVKALTDTPGQTDANWEIVAGGGPVFGYQLIVDSTGLPVAANSSADVVIIDTTTPEFIQVSNAQNDSNGFPGSTIHTGSSNIWLQAIVTV